MAPKRNGPPYRRVTITFWTDPDVKNVLSRDEKLFLNYLFTNEHSHPCGVYRLRPIIVMDELEFTKAEMRAMLDGPLAPFATYDWRTEEVFVHAMAEHQIDGKGLHGQDKRIPWVTTALQMVHATHLVEAFRARYSEWNLPWAEVLPDSTPTPPDGPGSSWDPENVSDRHDSEEPHNHAEKEGASQGASKGHGKPDPVPDPVSVPEAIYQPASSGSRTGQVGKRTTEEHPDLDRLWAELEPVVRERWHQGQEAVRIYDDLEPVGMPLERLKLNDLLWGTGKPEFVRWAVYRALLVLEYSNPATLFLLDARFEQVWGAYCKAEPADPGSVVQVNVKSPPGPTTDGERERRRQELRSQAEEVRSA